MGLVSHISFIFLLYILLIGWNKYSHEKVIGSFYTSRLSQIRWSNSIGNGSIDGFMLFNIEAMIFYIGKFLICASLTRTWIIVNCEISKKI